MCRNIKTLFNFDPPVTDEEVRAASLQFVRKISGFNKPSKANEASFLAAVDEVAGISSRLLRSLETNAPPKNREEGVALATQPFIWFFDDDITFEPNCLPRLWSTIESDRQLGRATPAESTRSADRPTGVAQHSSRKNDGPPARRA